MSGELTTAKTHLAALQNEVTSLRQKEAELSSQLRKVTSEAEKYKNELSRTKDSHTGQLNLVSSTELITKVNWPPQNYSNVLSTGPSDSL